ncbi:MAG: hypothetical protein MI749_15140 [Desulfovibrionales bacterium]|nr:hypothetical protein [Desulfovibrionales bacterium]
MKYLLTAFLLVLSGCGRWYEVAERPIQVPRTVAAYTLKDFHLCYRLLNKNDSYSLNKMLYQGRCIIVLTKAFEPTIIPTEEQDYVYGILYPQEEYVFINKNAYYASPNKVLGKEPPR